MGSMETTPGARHLSRRSALAGLGAAVSGGLLAGAPVARAAARDTQSVEALIIGSGYAGSVAAHHLALAGIRAVVLERGRRWPITAEHNTFSTLTAPDHRSSWMSTTLPVPKYAGVLETTQATGVTVATGAGVGGSSLVNHGLIMQPSGELFQRSFGDTLDYDEMARLWYPAALRMLGATPIPDDVLADPHYSSAREFIKQAQAAGLRTSRAAIQVDWNVVRDEIAGKVPAAAIAGESELGINSGAKLSVDRTILAAAERTGRISVRVLHQVTDVSRAADGRYRVQCERIDEFGTVVDRPVFLARYVFLAAGSMGTSKLLVRAKGRGTLPELPDSTGRFWGDNADRLAIRVGMPGPPSTGGPAHIVATDWRDPAKAITLAEFPGGASPVPGEGVSGTFAMQITEPDGSFAYDSATDSAKLTYPNDDPGLDTVLGGVLDRLNAANPGTRTYNTTAAYTSHPLGGAVLGRTCDSDGTVFGHPNLFVVDSSLIPGSAGAVTPALTVTALASRTVTRAIRTIQKQSKN
ncbi:GMC oxidoreductase [Streptomyces sp. NBC_00059]|uniref:GMC oxidoreductase n=1 Tax=Streptomyces sp. NBC_00059 TaxID=2975635 RepID=UPI002253B941|nr:GMC oxidoreductase [Streptomyces sp. NBC_00059]MCX5415797.1 GMC oxidoreductase [Streptomyces sp. NBC_00059]